MQSLNKLKKTSNLSHGLKNKQQLLIYLDQAILKLYFADLSIPSKSSLFLKEIKDLTPDQLSDEIKKILRQTPWNGSSAQLLIPRAYATIKNIELPSAPEDEMISMLRFQIARLVPHSLDEIVYAYRILNASGEKTNVRISVVLKKKIEEGLWVLNKAGIFPDGIYIASELLPKNISSPPQFVLIDIDFAQTQVSFVEQQKVSASRSFEIGMRNLDHPSEYERFQRGVAESLTLKPQHFSDRNIPFIVAGSKEGVQKSLSLLSKAYQNQISAYETDLFVPPDRSELYGKTSLLSLASFLDEPDLTSLNLMPQEVIAKYEKKEFYGVLKTLFIRLSFFFLILTGLGVTEYFFEWRDFDQTLKNVRLIREKAEELDHLKSSLLILNDHLKHRSHPFDVCLSLFQTMSADISIKSLVYDSGQLDIRGYASSLSKIFEFSGVLQKRPFFSKIETKYARQSALGRNEFSEFYIECTFKK